MLHFGGVCILYFFCFCFTRFDEANWCDFSTDKLHLSPVSAVVQLHPQLHHLDAMDEMPKGRPGKGRKEGEEERPEAEARAVDVKVKGAEDRDVMMPGNLDLLKRMQDEQWKGYDWVDAEVCSFLF